MKKKIPIKAKLEKPKPRVVRIDPYELDTSIVTPEVTYQLVMDYEDREVFRGGVIPLPTVIPYYLKHMELLVVLVIMEQTFKNGECRLNIREMAQMLKVTTVSITNALHSLRKQGLILEGDYKKGDKVKVRKVNFAAVQHLSDLADGHDTGVLSRIRKATRKKEIMKLTEEDLMGAYDNEVLPPGHDPREEEEYN